MRGRLYVKHPDLFKVSAHCLIIWCIRECEIHQFFIGPPDRQVQYFVGPAEFLSVRHKITLKYFFVCQPNRQVKQFVGPAEYLSVPDRRTDGFSHSLLYGCRTAYIL